MVAPLRCVGVASNFQTSSQRKLWKWVLILILITKFWDIELVTDGVSSLALTCCASKMMVVSRLRSQHFWKSSNSNPGVCVCNSQPYRLTLMPIALLKMPTLLYLLHQMLPVSDRVASHDLLTLDPLTLCRGRGCT